MKYREGFVSNSSSSSFLIIGTSDERLIDRIIEAKKLSREHILDEINMGYYDAGDVSFWGDHETIYHAGTDLCEDEIDKMPLLIIKQKFSKKLKEKYNLDISVEKIHMYYGESSS